VESGRGGHKQRPPQVVRGLAYVARSKRPLSVSRALMAACASQPSSSITTSATASPVALESVENWSGAIQAALQASEGNLEVVEAMQLRWKVRPVTPGRGIVHRVLRNSPALSLAARRGAYLCQAGVPPGPSVCLLDRHPPA
jgi:hypothetical protein